ncbi:hypothetical protein FACS1894176_01230 [Bacteroidia bacterium]|nr:hypothetical protein FACS1894176_01230 [Bacteroidia bacterium]
MSIALFHTLIQKLLHDYEGGTKFFDALDKEIRTNPDILQLFIDFLQKTIEEKSCKHTTLILSGEFGCALISLYGKLLFATFHHILLVKGGLRNQGNLEYIYMEQPAL